MSLGFDCEVYQPELEYVTQHFLFCVDFPEHAEHGLVVGVVEEPDVALLGVLFEGHRVAVSHVQKPLAVLPQQDSDHAFVTVLLAHAIVVVHHRQQHDWVHCDLLYHFKLLF